MPEEETQPHQLPSETPEPQHSPAETVPDSPVNGEIHQLNDAVELKLEPVMNSQYDAGSNDAVELKLELVTNSDKDAGSNDAVELRLEPVTNSDKDAGSNGVVFAAVSPELSKTLTTKELLGDQEGQIGQSSDSASPPQSEGISQQQYQNNAAMELINSINGADEESQSRQRILTYAARRYATAIERNPRDYDALYNWALVLQESADNVDPESASPSKDALLEEACKKYEEATRLCRTLHDAYYNWAIAISDRARMRGRTKEAEELWKQATEHYEKTVQLNWNSPQALNNWGLALQELSAIVPAKEKHNIIKRAISKFRAAIQLQFDFHRAIYNLGTVLYGLAEDLLRIGGSTGSQEVSPDELYSQCAIYIAAAHALKPNYSVYRSALRLVRSMLPLPYLKVGYLKAPPASNSNAPHSEWKRTQFILSHEGLYQLVRSDEQKPSLHSLSGNQTDASKLKKQAVRVEIPEIVSISPCADLTLPPGAGLCINTIHGPVYLVADAWDSLDGWLDAIRLVYTIYARGKGDVLAGVITG